MDTARPHTCEGHCPATPPLLRLYLFGGFRVERDSGPPPAERWPRPSARALVKLLAVTPGHSLHREQAMEICWPDADPQSALGSLRVALHAARHAVEPELAPRAASSYLTAEGSLLRLDPRTVWIDADHAERLAERALAAGDSTALAAALGAFTGELLPEDRYAAWATPRRERLAGLRERLLTALAEAHLAEGSLEEAADTARRILEESPAEERAHRVLIGTCLSQGLRRQAVRQYHLCREVLDTELGVRPGPETERLHRLALDDGVAPPLSSTGPVAPAAIRAPAASPLRGRGRELNVLLDPEAPPVLLLCGEAGLGKTRLVGEAARCAARDGAAVLWGAGHDAEGHTPYGAFVEALDGWLADRPPDERARAGAEYPELAALLPSLGQAGTAAEHSPEEERERLFRATAGLLGDLAANRTVHIVLDDLHAADSGSFQLLSHLARLARTARRRWRFTVTFRPEELPATDPRHTALDALVRQDLAGRIELERLDRGTCLALAADALGLPGGESGAAVDRIWQLSLGNPLFALELARALNDGTDVGSLGACEGIRQLVAERLARLDSGARRVVEVVSAAGGDAALAEVLDVAGQGLHPRLSEAEASAATDAAVAASVLTERQVVADGRPVPGLAFRHPLVRLTCYEQLSSARRKLLHSAYAEAVLRRRPDAVDTLASHLARADDPRATGYLRRAAERAAALCANDTADRYYAELTGRLDALTAQAAKARIDRGAVLRRMARYDEAALLLSEALDDLRRRGDHDMQVLATARLAEVLAKIRRTDEGFRLLEACPPRPGTPAEAAASHHLARAMLCFVTGRYEDATVAARSAEHSARAVTAPAARGLLARALGIRATALGSAGRLTEALPVADRALPHAEAYGDPALLASVLSILREHARRSGRLREAVSTGLRALALTERCGDPTAAVFERANLAELHLLLEEVDQARHLAEEAVRRAEPHSGWCTPYALVALARVRMRTGDEGAAELLDRARDTAVAQGDRQAQDEARLARAELAVRQKCPGKALELLAGCTGAGTAHLAAWAKLARGEPAAAADLAAEEAARAERAGERLAETDARTVHAAALAALGRERESCESFDRAAALAETLPYPAGAHRTSRARSRALVALQNGFTVSDLR